MRHVWNLWRKRLKTIWLLVNSITGFASALVGLFATSVGATIISWYTNNSNYFYLFGAFSLGFLIAAILFIASSRTFTQEVWLRGYKWLKAEYLYQFHEDDPKHHSQTVTIEIEAVRSGVETFENRYLWSGNGEEDIKLLSSEQTYLGKTQSAMWNFYYILFENKPQIGDKRTIKVVQTLYDGHGKFEPFLNKTVKEPVEDLTLKVQFRTDQTPCNIYFEEEVGTMPTNVIISRREGSFENTTRQIVWNIPDPKINHCYTIRWRYS